MSLLPSARLNQCLFYSAALWLLLILKELDKSIIRHVISILYELFSLLLEIIATVILVLLVVAIELSVVEDRRAICCRWQIRSHLLDYTELPSLII